MTEERSAEMPLKEAGTSDYDRFYADEGEYASYDAHYKKSHYYPVQKRALEEAVLLGGKKILEVGCGSGAFAELLFDTTDLSYTGFDFSAVAVEKARTRCGDNSVFSVADARDPQSYSEPYDTIICMEVLEHIVDDLLAIQNWRSGCNCVCTVPNFDSHDHVRVFHHENEIKNRYGDLIAIDRIIRVARPPIRGRNFREYLRQLRWNRNNPKKLMALLGYRTFDNLAGWFIFSGKRR